MPRAKSKRNGECYIKGGLLVIVLLAIAWNIGRYSEMIVALSASPSDERSKDIFVMMIPVLNVRKKVRGRLPVNKRSTELT